MVWTSRVGTLWLDPLPPLHYLWVRGPPDLYHTFCFLVRRTGKGGTWHHHYLLPTGASELPPRRGQAGRQADRTRWRFCGHLLHYTPSSRVALTTLSLCQGFFGLAAGDGHLFCWLGIV